MRHNSVVKHHLSNVLFGTLLLSSFALSMSLATQPALALGIDYASITERKGDLVRIKRSTLAEEHWYTCFISTRACLEVASTSPLTTDQEPTPPVPAWRSLLPAGATWRTVSPDGRYVAFYIAATQSRGKRTFGVLDTTTSTIYTKDENISYWDLLTEGINIFSFSPDSKTLLYLDDVTDHPTFYKVDLTTLSGNTTLPSKKFFSKGYSIADMEWKDSDTLLYIANRDNPYEWALYEYTLSKNSLKKISSNVSYAVNLIKVGDLFLFGEADEKGVRPALYDPATGSISHFDLPAVLATPVKGKVVTTLKNGVSGTFFLERSGNSDTLLVWLHGGPFRQTALGYHPYLSYDGYDWVMAEAQAANVGVLKIDYPGSAGFGRIYAESVTGKVGVKDANDVATAVADFAKRNGYKNVYLMGNSYGGYLALKLLVDKPSAYKGAMSIAGVADWTTMLTALDNSIFNVQFKGTIGDENNDLYTKASIYNHLSDLTTQKVVLVHGTKDLTIPYRQSDGLNTYMTSIGKPPLFVTLDGEDHVFKKPASYITLCIATLQMLGKATESHCAL